jgi:hypothetical protein
VGTGRYLCKVYNYHDSRACDYKGSGILVDVSYAAPQVHEIVNVGIHREYSPGIIFIFSQGKISIMSKTNTGSNSNEYY